MGLPHSTITHFEHSLLWQAFHYGQSVCLTEDFSSTSVEINPQSISWNVILTPETYVIAQVWHKFRIRSISRIRHQLSGCDFDFTPSFQEHLFDRLTLLGPHSLHNASLIVIIGSGSGSLSDGAFCKLICLNLLFCSHFHFHVWKEK